jgi:hypothetical protein
VNPKTLNRPMARDGGKMSDTTDEKEHEKEDIIESTLEEMTLTEDNIEIVMVELKSVHEETGKRYYEYDRLKRAVRGGYQNINELSGKSPIVDPTTVTSISSNCSGLRIWIQKEISTLENFKRSMGNVPTTQSLSASAVQILYGSTGAYEANANAKGLPPIPPSVKEKIDPYSEDQPEVVEDLRKHLKDIDPDLENSYMGAKEIFESPQRTRLKAASSNMRTIIWEVYRRLAPHEKVAAAPGFKQIKKDAGISTYRQRVAYILTGTADIDGPDVTLINTIFQQLGHALEVFSGEVKQVEVDHFSDYQVKKTMAQCERALLGLLKNRKV